MNTTTNTPTPAPGDLVRVDTPQENYIDLISTLPNPTTALFRDGTTAPLSACTTVLPSSIILALALSASSGPPRNGTLDHLLIFLHFASLLLPHSTPCPLTTTPSQTTLKTQHLTLTLSTNHAHQTL